MIVGVSMKISAFLPLGDDDEFFVVSTVKNATA
jgi:hypothetical protein